MFLTLWFLPIVLAPSYWRSCGMGRVKTKLVFCFPYRISFWDGVVGQSSGKEVIVFGLRI